MSGTVPTDDRLLHIIRRIAAAAAVCVWIFVVLDDRDPTIIGLVSGAMFVLLGLITADYLQRKR